LGGEYFTSGSALQLSSQFIWCAANATPFGPNVFWAPGEPSLTGFTGTEENCVSIKLSKGAPKKNELRDIACSENMKYICEVGNVLFLVVF
jgi:hypothetical protein